MYRSANRYHNFQHALDVLQATYFFLYSAGVVPPVSILSHSDGRLWKPKARQGNSYISSLTDLDLLALYITAVGHDVGHPGLTNAFLVSHLCTILWVRADADLACRKTQRHRWPKSTMTSPCWSRCIMLSWCRSCERTDLACSWIVQYGGSHFARCFS